MRVDQNYRWRPHTRALCQAVRDDRIGQVVSASYEFRQAITSVERGQPVAVAPLVAEALAA